MSKSGGLVFVESSCLVDTWSMAKQLVRAVTRNSGGARAGRADAIRVLDDEAARGTDLASVNHALWGLLAGYEYRKLAELLAVQATGCIDRADALGRTAARVMRQHRRAGDTIVVVSDLIPVFVQPLREHLRVHRVMCGEAPVDSAGRLARGFPGILLGNAAGSAVELVARQEAVPLAHCVAYGRDPRDRELLRAVGHAVRIDYGGRLQPASHLPNRRAAVTDEAVEHCGAPARRRTRPGSAVPRTAIRPMPQLTTSRTRSSWRGSATA